MFQIDRVSVTSTDSYRCDSYCLARVFQNLPAPPKHFGIFDVFLFCKVFSQPENLGSHLAMSPDDRFQPQCKESFPKICQVRPMPNDFGAKKARAARYIIAGSCSFQTDTTRMRRVIVIAFFQQLDVLSSAFICMDFNFCFFYIERGILICWRLTLLGREIYLLRILRN